MGDYISEYLLKQGLNAPGVVYTDEEPNEEKNKSLISAVSKLQNEVGNRETGIGVDLTPLGDTEKYTKLGIRPGVQTLRAQEEGYLDNILSDKQSATNKLWHGLTQSLVNEIGLGTMLGFSDIADYVIGSAIRKINGEDNDYTNPVSAKIQEWQKHFEEYQPIYRDASLDISNGGLLDSGWWASNMPSIMSSIALLIPSTITTKGLKYLSKTVKAGSKTAAKWAARATKLSEAKTAQNVYNRFKDISTISSARKAQLGLLGEVTTNALLSRTMENYQEARQVHDDMYEAASNTLNNMTPEEYSDFIKRKEPWLDGIDINNKDEVAKRIATISADETFKLDYANTIFDVIELYALRNLPFKGFRNEKSSASVRRKHLNSIKYAGKTPEQIVDAMSKRTFGQKAAENIEDFLYGSKWTIAGQLSEGVEEAVNYVAQQEGMHVGDVILGNAKDSIYDNRLAEYVKSPGLWESAFWGVLGGVVFQGLGSGFNRAANAIEASIENKKYKENDKTGEKIKKPTWKELWETPETKRRKADIEARIGDLEEYKRKIATINEDKNPYEDNRPITKGEKDLLLEKAYTEMLTNMTLRAMDSGNYDLLKEYLSSDEVRDAIAESGVVTKEEATDYQQHAIERMEKIEKQYDDNMVALNNLSKELNRNRKDAIPIEYIQIIARNNIQHQLQIEDLEAQLAAWEAEGNEQQAFFKDKLDNSIDYKNAVRLVFLTRQLGELEADKRELLKDKEHLATVTGQQELEQLNQNIKTVRDLVYNIDPEDGVTNLLFAIQNAMSFKKFGTEAKSDFTDKEYIKFRKKVRTLEKAEDAKTIEKIDDYLASIDSRLAGMSKNQLYQNRVLDDNVRRAYGRVKGLDAVSKELHQTYFRLADLQTAIALERSQIKLTADEVSNEVHNLHNFMNEIRVKAIESAHDMLVKLADKYGTKKVRDTFYNVYVNNTKAADNEFGTEAEDIANAKIFNDAIDILNLEAGTNRNLFGTVDELLKLNEDIKAAQKKKSSTSAETNTATESAKVDNSSTEQPKTNTEQSEQKKQPQSTQTTQPQQPETEPSNPAYNGEIELNNGEVTYAKLTPNTDEEGTYELNVTPGNTNATALLNNDELFDKQGVSLTEDFIIKEKPIVRRSKDGQLIPVKRGTIVRATPENIVGQEENNSNQQGRNNAGISFTGDESEYNNQPLTDTDKPSDWDLETEIGEAIQSEVVRSATLDTNLDFAELEKKINEKYTNRAANKKDVSHYVKMQITSFKKMYDRIRKKKTTPIDEVFLKASAISDRSKNKGKLLEDFGKAVDKLIKKYRDDVAIDHIDGKYYVRLDDLLRYCNEESQNSAMGSLIYDTLLNYMKTSNEYELIDGNLEDALNRVNDTVATRLSRSAGDTGLYGINFDGYVTALLSNGLNSEANKILSIIDNLNIGDKIMYKATDNGVVFIVGDTVIGSLPLPQVGDKGQLIQYNDGWKTDVLVNSDGSVDSELKGLFKHWLVDLDNPDIKEINDLAIAIAFGKLSNTKIDTLAKQFMKNPEVIKAQKQGFIKPSADANQLLRGLAKIWGYTRQATGRSIESTNSIREASLDRWFETEVAPSFAMVNTLYNTNSGVVEVGHVSEGELIITEGKMLPVSKAIGEKHKSKIRIAAAEKLGELIVAGDGVEGQTTLKFSGVGGSVDRANTVVVIPARNGHHGYVHAYPQTISSKLLGKKVKSVVTAAMAEIKRISEQKDENGKSLPTNVIGEQIEQYLMNLINSYDSNVTPLFRTRVQRGRKGIEQYVDSRTGDKMGFVFHYIEPNGNPHNIRISWRGYNDKNNVTYFREKGLTVYDNSDAIALDDTTAAVEYLQKAILNNTKFNLGFSFIHSDNNPRIQLKGLASRSKDGKFVITIPNQGSFEFDSFNDFIVNNDAVMLTTEPGPAGNNYNRQSTIGNQAANQALKVKLLNDNTSPVKETNNTPSPVKTTTQKILDILNDKTDTKDVGKRIARLIYGSKVKNFKYNSKIFDLFPQNIKFVNESIGRIALSNTGTTNKRIADNSDIEVEPGQVLIGKEWFELLDKGVAGQKEAVRKLIHERLHLVLHTNGNEKYIEQIRNIFDTFVAKSTNKELKKYQYNTTKEDEAKYWTDGKLNVSGLEEFLVETLTSEQLATELNSIKVEETEYNKPVILSLFQKIMKNLATMFGWHIKKNSLYEEEFKALADIMSDNKPLIEDTTSETNSGTQEKVTEEKQQTETETVQTNEMNFDDDALFESNITETDSHPSVSTFVDSFPLEQQANIRRKIEDGIIQTKCN